MVNKKNDDQRLQETLDAISRVVLCQSSTKEPDWKKTERYRAERSEEAIKSHKATIAGRAAFERLLSMTEARSSGQIEIIAKFLWSTWHRSVESRFDIFDLRCLDTEISDDMFAVMDAVRWKEIPVSGFTEDLSRRMPAMAEAWGIFKVQVE